MAANQSKAVSGSVIKENNTGTMPVFGLTNGLIPILAYNYGARKKNRIDEAMRFALKLAFGIMLCGTITETRPSVLPL